MPGPLPNPNRRRRNVPTIPSTSLPAAGRVGPPPDLPSWVELGEAGSAFWLWVWATPQAAAWSDGHVPFVARRAELEDDAAALAAVEGLDLSALDDDASAHRIERVIRAVAAVASGKMALFKEMRELDNRLGLNPKGQQDLRWEIVADDPPGEKKPASVRRLKAVDPAAVG